jgi:hypothetical protein
MGRSMSEPSVISETADYTARGMAAEAIQTCRSHEQLDILRFTNMERQHHEIKVMFESLTSEMREGFKSYDAKFWSLAITLIVTLMTVCGTLIYHFVLKGA